ncbi:N-acetylmuramic acid 6-phosphate etherase [candidate division KSB1 bacterium]|nr:N-acetylmuramic acid 6-phosphate etherase [candidate division KSB1 bacterium]
MVNRELFNELNELVTEKRNPNTMEIDSKSIPEILQLINAEDKTVPNAVEKEIPYITQAVEILVNCFKNGGRLFYIGAGTSGRLGVLDASECPPTFGVKPELIQGIIAGGYKALIAAQEGAEDRKEVGARELLEHGFNQNDVACGIAASRRTPYVVGAIEQARKIGAKTLYITCTPRSEMKIEVDVAICPVVGPEVIMGSTRMKAGTAQKLVLNMLTTTTMIRLGKVYKNMMVDLQMTSKKLEERSKRTLMIVTGIDYETAEKVLAAAHGHVKTAVVMILAKISREEAIERLKRHDGFVRQAIQSIS